MNYNKIYIFRFIQLKYFLLILLRAFDLHLFLNKIMNTCRPCYIKDRNGKDLYYPMQYLKLI